MKSLNFDKELIAQQICDVVNYNLCFCGNRDLVDVVLPDSLGISKLISDWESNKAHIIESSLFDGALIKNLGIIKIRAPQEALFKQFLIEMSDFLWENDMYNEEFSIMKFFKENKDGFFDNVVKKDYSDLDIFLNKGRKISKALKEFIPYKFILRQVQDLYSTYIQKQYITGELCLSVHPLDYLSSSETTLNWRSCHSLNGSYCGGNFSHMTDQGTIVCYIKTGKDIKLPRFPNNVLWNNKKWRMLVHFDDTMKKFVAFDRQYPLRYDELEKIIYNEIKAKINNNFSELETSVSDIDFCSANVSRRIVHENSVHRAKEFVIYHPLAANFNDLLYSTFNDFNYCYDESAFEKKEDGEFTTFKIHAGAPYNCLYCGNPNTNANTYVCETCEKQIKLFYNINNHQGKEEFT